MNNSRFGRFHGLIAGVPRDEQDGNDSWCPDKQKPNPGESDDRPQQHTTYSQAVLTLLVQEQESRMSTNGNKVVITGGEGDLAREIAKVLSAAGLEVSAPGRAELDVTNKEAVRDYFQKYQVDLLICNAGITRDHGLARLTENDWDEVIDVNLKGTIRCARAAIESMKQRGGGHVVVISSYSAIHPPPGQVAYATAKASLLGLVDEWSKQHGADNIRINAILPGFLETKMTQSVRGQRKAEVLAQHALKQFNTPAQVGAFIRTLHQELTHTSGQIFQLDSRSSHQA